MSDWDNEWMGNDYYSKYERNAKDKKEIKELKAKESLTAHETLRLKALLKAEKEKSRGNYYDI